MESSLKRSHKLPTCGNHQRKDIAECRSQNVELGDQLLSELRRKESVSW